jgi:hypothetical protein
MLRAMRSAALTCLAVLSIVSGCAYGQMREVLRTQVASEADCPEIQVTKKGLKYFDEDEESDQYKVSGCGVLRTYTCPQKSGMVKYGSEPCTFVEGDPDQPTMKAPTPQDSEDPFGDAPMAEEAEASDDEGESADEAE